MSQTSTRVGWTGGLGWWAGRQCQGFTAFALCPCSRRIVACAPNPPYRVTSYCKILNIINAHHANPIIHGKEFPGSSHSIALDLDPMVGGTLQSISIDSLYSLAILRSSTIANMPRLMLYPIVMQEDNPTNAIIITGTSFDVHKNPAELNSSP